MKTMKYLLLMLVTAVSFSSCVMHERVVQPRRAYWVPGYYGYGPYHSRHWIRGHYR